MCLRNEHSLSSIQNISTHYFFQGFDEIWFSQTDKLAPKVFNRIWLYLGLGYKFNPKTNLQLGYMNQWDVIGNDTFVSTPIIQTTFVRNFDL